MKNTNNKGLFHNLIFSLAMRIPWIVPDALFLKILYYHITDNKLNLSAPKSYNEKIQWLKLYDRKPQYTIMVDKYEAKNYIKGIIGEQYIIPTLKVYNDVDDIDFDSLPSQFVLKCTHDSGGVVICKDKRALNIQNTKNILRAGLKQNFYWQNREWPYKNVPHRIIAEKYMIDESGTELKDYKFFCFNGEPKIVQVDYDRFNGHKRNLYDLEWKRLPFTLQFPTDWDHEISKPESLEEMLEISRKLSKGIPHVRVDLYHIKGKVYFGELTFFHGSGFEKFTPEEWNITFGEWLNLNNN